MAGNNNNYPSAAGVIGTYADPIQVTVDLTAAGSGWTATFEGTDVDTSAVLFDSSPYTVTTGGSVSEVGFHSEQNTSLVSNFSLTEEAVPEPSTWVLMGVGLLALVMIQRRRAANEASV